MKLDTILKQGRRILPLLTVLGLVSAAPAYSADGLGAYALKDAKIVRVSGAPIEKGVVVVRDGLIEAVGENVTIPADAWVIDCKGLTVYPGMIDAFSTLGIASAASSGSAAAAGGRRGGAAATPAAAAAAAAAAAEPVARGPEDRPSNESYAKAIDSVSATDSRIESFRNGGFLSAATFPAGKIFNGNGSLINLAGEKPGNMVIADSIGQSIVIVARGFGMSRGYPNSLMGYIAYVRQMYLDAERYKQAQAIYAKNPTGLQRPAYDRTLEGLLASPRMLLPAVRATEIERMVTFAKELKQPVVIYGAHEAYKEADFLKKANVPVIVSLKWPTKTPDGDPTAVEALRTLELRDKAPSSPAALAKAGVKFAFYADGLATPKEVLAAVKKSVDSGLSPADAIRALTLTPAEIYGVSDRLGSIDKGKIANLVIAEGDIFAPATKLKYVFVDGTKFEVPEAPAAGRGFGRGASGPGANDFQGDKQ